jgi:hypothetical protein
MLGYCMVTVNILGKLLCSWEGLGDFPTFFKAEPNSQSTIQPHLGKAPPVFSVLPVLLSTLIMSFINHTGRLCSPISQMRKLSLQEEIVISWGHWLGCPDQINSVVFWSLRSRGTQWTGKPPEISGSLTEPATSGEMIASDLHCLRGRCTAGGYYGAWDTIKDSPKIHFALGYILCEVSTSELRRPTWSFYLTHPRTFYVMLKYFYLHYLIWSSQQPCKMSRAGVITLSVEDGEGQTRKGLKSKSALDRRISWLCFWKGGCWM